MATAIDTTPPLSRGSVRRQSPISTPSFLHQRDIHISVHGLTIALPPAMLPSGVIAIVFASRGGQSPSAAKRQRAQENGRKDGRPRKRKVGEFPMAVRAGRNG